MSAQQTHPQSIRRARRPHDSGTPEKRSWDFEPTLALMANRLDGAVRCLRRQFLQTKCALASKLPRDDEALAYWLESTLHRAADRVENHVRPFDALEVLWENSRHDTATRRDAQALVAIIVATLSEVLGRHLDRETRLAWICACNLLVAEAGPISPAWIEYPHTAEANPSRH